jgi:hypothetical protein
MGREPHGGVFADVFPTDPHGWSMKAKMPPRSRNPKRDVKGEIAMHRLSVLLTLLMLCLLPATARTARADEKSALDNTMERMAEQHQHDKPTATAAATTPPAQEVTGEEVVYGQVGGKPVRGYLAHPKGAKAALPGLIVIHEWWGLTTTSARWLSAWPARATPPSPSISTAARAPTPRRRRRLSWAPS